MYLQIREYIISATSKGEKPIFSSSGAEPTDTGSSVGAMRFVLDAMENPFAKRSRTMIPPTLVATETSAPSPRRVTGTRS